MKFQTLKKDNRKYWLIGIGVVLIIAVVLCFVGTRAKYRNIQSIQVAKGTINYTTYDFNIVAMYDQDGNELTTMPNANEYIINEANSYCTVNGEKDTNAILKTIDRNHTFANLQKGSKCYLIFEKQTAKDVILADNGGKDVIETKASPVLGKTSCAANTNCSSTSGCTTSCGEATNGMYATQDDDGASYYFRGSVDNNWVSFGGFYWRIIRINGDGTIRIIYNGTTAGATGTSAQLSTTSAFNESYKDNMYVGYMYTSGEVHGTGVDSTIKGNIDSWYNTNLNKTGAKEYIDTNAGFCNDRTPYSGSGIGTTETSYAPENRLQRSSATPSLKCTSTADLFTLNSSTKGNKALTYPIGLITADEVSYAGASFNETNYGIWLFTGENYYTITPSKFDSRGLAYVYIVTSGGQNYSTSGNYQHVNYSRGIRPVINLKADTIFSSGNGTVDSPYVVKTS